MSCAFVFQIRYAPATKALSRDREILLEARNQETVQILPWIRHQVVSLLPTPFWHNNYIHRDLFFGGSPTSVRSFFCTCCMSLATGHCSFPGRGSLECHLPPDTGQKRSRCQPLPPHKTRMQRPLVGDVNTWVSLLSRTCYMSHANSLHYFPDRETWE
jgi:hypothetical protein